ncbi:MAG: substrate-binding domain-containing protein [Planctomycetales bacterium]|nr:substrate-binding domain-containing protein [Planctomycetales bacterium]
MQNIERYLSTLAVALLAAVSLVGCGSQEQAATKRLVVFSQCNNAEPYRASQNERFQELFSKHPDIKFVISDGQADASKQISQIENAILQKPDVLIVAPLERSALSGVMGEAMAAGIPTICLERDIAEPNYTTFVSCDNVEIGRLAGQFIVDYLTKKNGAAQGVFVEISGMQGVQAAKDRHDGAFEVLQQHPEIKVAHQATGNWFQAEAMARMEEALSANAEIDVVYAHNDPMAYGAYLAAKEQGRHEEIAFVGVDGLPHEGVKYVEDGILAATFEYPLCVDKAVELTVQLLADKEFTPEKTYILESRSILGKAD